MTISISGDIKVLHIESTDVCQAACPACARETDLCFDQKIKHHLTIEQIKQHIDDAGIKNLDKMFMCGNYGDPAAGRYTLDIYQHFRQINPQIELGMNTNGAIQNSAWWQTLGGIFHRQRDYVVFSIDGLADTNHVYRRGVDWNKLIENIRSYVSTGAAAHWDMLVYQHNEHQVDACEQLARSLGFTWFRAKVSKRQLINGLKYPLKWHKPQESLGQIDCYALLEKSAYIDSQGRLHPCCWLGHRDPVDFASIQQSWKTPNPEPICQRTCASQKFGTSFTNQWQRNVALN